MLGQLPQRHQAALWAVGVVFCIAAGAWLAFIAPIPLVWQYGAVLGALLAPALIVLYGRTLTVDTSRPRPSRG